MRVVALEQQQIDDRGRETVPSKFKHRRRGRRTATSENTRMSAREVENVANVENNGGEGEGERGGERKERKTKATEE